MKSENKNILIIILVVIGLFYLIGQKDITPITDLDEDLMDKQSKFSDSPWHIESRLSSMSEEDREDYLINRFSKKTYIVGGATCSSEPDLSDCLESDLSITCPSTWEGNTNYGCSIDIWTAVDDNCAYDVHDAYLGKYDKTPGQVLSLSGHDAYFYDVYFCTDKECACGTETNKGCGDWGCDDDEMTRKRTCTPHECGDKEGWTEHADEWYYCATGFSECQDCDSHDYYTCSNNDIYYYDSCDDREEKKKECGSNGCTNGATVCSGGTVPSLIEVSRTIKSYDDLNIENKIVGTFVLKNVGAAMTSNWILEMQVNRLEQVQAVYVSPQKTCEPSTPYNVHKEFKLGADEQATIELTSSNIPESMILANGNTFVLGVITEECGCTDFSCYKDPYKAGATFGSHVVKSGGDDDDEGENDPVKPSSPVVEVKPELIYS